MMASIQGKVFCWTNACFSRTKSEAGLELWIQESSKKNLTISLSSANAHFKSLSIGKKTQYVLGSSDTLSFWVSHLLCGLLAAQGWRRAMSRHRVATGVLVRASEVPRAIASASDTNHSLEASSNLMSCVLISFSLYRQETGAQRQE